MKQQTPVTFRERSTNPASYYCENHRLAYTAGSHCTQCSVPCGHSACRQHWIDTGETECVHRDATVKRATLFGEVIDTHQTEAELNGFRATQGMLL